MTLPELPMLRPYATRGYSPSMKHAGKPTAYAAKSVEARESILVAEIKQLRNLWIAAEERAAYAEQAALSHADIIVKLRAECEAMRMVPSELPPIPDNWHMPITDQERANEEAFRRGWNACCKAVAARSAP